MSRDPFIEALDPLAGDRILDIGAGKGAVANRVLQASTGAEVFAVEPNESRAEALKRDYPAIKCSVSGAEELPFPDSFFDKAYTTMALHHFSDLTKALHEVQRVLKRGGSFVIIEVEPGSGLGMVFRFFGKLMGEHMSIMAQGGLVEKLKAAGGFEEVTTVNMGSRYLIHLRRI